MADDKNEEDEEEEKVHEEEDGSRCKKRTKEWRGVRSKAKGVRGTT